MMRIMRDIRTRTMIQMDREFRLIVLRKADMVQKINSMIW